MKIEIIWVSRRPPWPMWAVLLALLWLGLGGTTILLAEFLGRPVQLCLFKRLTGIACPTCGFTRGALNLLQGRIVEAWLYNPLLYSTLALFAGFVLLRLVFGRAIRIDMSRTERMIVWILAFVLFIANWAYVIVYVG